MTPEERERWDRVYDPVTGRARYFRLVGQSLVPCSLGEWAVWVEAGCPGRRVRLTRIGPFKVSTWFLGRDHALFGSEPPVLFETQTFLVDSCGGFDAGGVNKYDGRSSTWVEAELAHRMAVEFLQANYCAAGEEPHDEG